MPARLSFLTHPRQWRRAMERRLEPLQQYAPLAAWLGVYLVLSALLRIVLWARFDPGQESAWWHVLLILPAGAINDLVESLYLLLPFSVVLFLLPRRWVRSRVYRGVLALGMFGALFGLLYMNVAEYYFFEEFNSRFNLVAVNYIIYPTEVLTNIWDSYPVVPVVIVTALLSALGVLALAPWIFRRWELPLPTRRRLALLLAHCVLMALAILAYETDSLAYFRNRIDNEVANNGTSSFFRALRTMELNYNLHYRIGDPQRMFDLVAQDLGKHGGQFIHLDEHRLTRRFAADPHGLGKLNVVVLVQESLSAEFVGAYNPASTLTPVLDKLAPQGLHFVHTFASGTRTVRGLEAISASFPPIPTESIIRRPGSEHIANWGEVMRTNGYESLFLYGGYGYFDDMNHYFSSNGFRLGDRTDIKDQSFANIWGVCDEDLFRYAVKTFDEVHAGGKPFFAMIMSTSNHKPYTFPSGVPGVAPTGGGRAAGVRYADYAIGKFFEMARTKPWFDDTIVVIVADHGARVYGAEKIPMHSYRIPLFIISPKHIKPAQVQDVTSQLDVAPTVLGLLGLPYEAPFFGQNVLALHGASHPVLLNHNFDVGLMQDGRMIVLGLEKRVTTYGFDYHTDVFQPAPPDPRLIELATAYYQTAYDLFDKRRYR